MGSKLATRILRGYRKCPVVVPKSKKNMTKWGCLAALPKTLPTVTEERTIEVYNDATQEHLHDVLMEGIMEQGSMQQGFMEQGFYHLSNTGEKVQKVPSALSDYEYI